MSKLNNTDNYQAENSKKIRQVGEEFKAIGKLMVLLKDYSSADFMYMNKLFIELHCEAKKLIPNTKTSFNSTPSNAFIEKIECLNPTKESNLLNEIIAKLTKSNQLITKILDGSEKELSNLLKFRIKCFEIKSFIENNLLATVTKSNHNTLYKVAILRRNKFLLKITETRENELKDLGRSLVKVDALLQNYISVGIQSYKSQMERIVLLSKQYEETAFKTRGLVSLIDQIEIEFKECANSVIVNLQKQDIVQQKIDHAYKSHCELINELSILDEKVNNKPIIQEQAKLKLRIMDIAGLQAAQMIHAGNYYQNAVVLITSSLKKINLHCKNIYEIRAEISNYFKLLDAQREEFYNLFNTLSSNLKSNTEELVRLNELNETITKQAKIYRKSILDLTVLTEIVSKNLDNLIVNSVGDDAVSKIVDDKRQLCYNIDILANSNFQNLNIHSYDFSNLIEQLDELQDCVKSVLKEFPPGDLNPYPDYDVFKNKEIDNSGKYFSLIPCMEIGEPKNNQKFNTTISEIIEKLISVHQNYNEEKNIKEKSGPDKYLTQLKNNYTMDIEYQIHNYYEKNGETRMENFLKFLEQDSIQNNTNEAELF